MKKKLYIGTNTKMYKTASQTAEFLTRLDELTSDISRGDLHLFVIPSFTSLERASASVSDGRILLGAQNMSWEDEGQFTGEISPLMLKEAGVRIIEIGHSERRHVLRETDEEARKKVSAALRHGFTPLLCIGETKEQKDYGIANEVLRMQLKIAFHEITPEAAQRSMIAYEPVWAIGKSGVPATKEYAEEKHRVIKDTLRQLFGAASASIPVLYGGSVNNDNACGLLRMNSIDGLFIGRSAWDADNFNAIIRMTLPLIKEK